MMFFSRRKKVEVNVSYISRSGDIYYDIWYPREWTFLATMLPEGAKKVAVEVLKKEGYKVVE